ncbi:MAG TPA: GNAT family N-acetyltransferase [Candidatus Acidoferrum sp.]|nr:GNAT family N-acetyltransferase [Candidatus Acidoferrum sp.]
MQVQIEPARAEHLAEISALAAVTWRAHYPGIISQEQIDYMLARMYDVATMRRELESGIAYDRLRVDGTLCGFSSYGPASKAGELKLHKLYVHPDFQRQGFGAALLKRVEEFADEHYYSTLVLAVNKQNTRAFVAYRKLGFTIRESIIAGIGGGFVMNDYVMAKSLLQQHGAH